MKWLLTTLFSILSPSCCTRCGMHGTILCDACAVGLPMAKPVGTPHALPHAYAAYDYADPIVERAIRDLKYRMNGELADALVRAAIPHIAEYLSSVLLAGAPTRLLFVPIPQHRIRRLERGFNQSERIAYRLAAEIDGARVSNALKKIRHTGSQVKMKTKAERLNNLRHSMRADTVLDPIQTYVVVDDVTTTGSTFEEASRALREAGARNIICIALAHGYAARKKNALTARG